MTLAKSVHRKNVRKCVPSDIWMRAFFLTSYTSLGWDPEQFIMHVKNMYIMKLVNIREGISNKFLPSASIFLKKALISSIVISPEPSSSILENTLIA